jgi:allophanate hydrolase subunit 2
MDLIGQLQPHQAVRFEAVTMEAALAARRDAGSLADAVENATSH